MAKLNSRQQQAVEHGDGPLLILAGAGSGKTSTMAHRIAHLISNRRIPPAGILGLSFTRKAARELKDRVHSLCRGQKLEGLTIATFHSLCVILLRESGVRFTILDASDQQDVMRGVLRRIKLDDKKFDPQSLLFEIGQAKNRFLEGDRAREYLETSRGLSGAYSEVVGTVFGLYQEELKARGAFDFDDLIFQTVKMLSERAELRTKFAKRFQHVLVDEYQDTNPAQFKLLRLLCPGDRPNLCVVGDDDQSIYGWRGADSAHILEFTKQFPAAKMLTLDQNYRSTSTILDAANQVISKNRVRHPKTLWSNKGQGEPILQCLAEDDRGEAELVARKIMEGVQNGRRHQDFAVLYRSNPQSRVFEEALRIHGIPYKIVGTLSFMERKEIKDVLSYWRLVVDPRDDVSAKRVIGWPARGVGKSTVTAVAEKALSLGTSFVDGLRAVDSPPRAKTGAESFLALLEGLRSSLETCAPTPAAVSLWARSSLDLIGAKSALEAECADDPALMQRKWDNIEELASSIGQMPQRGAKTAADLLRDYLAQIALNEMDDEEEEDDRDQVTMLTLHGAKGLEFPVVFMVGMEDGYLPHKRSIEEARDLSEERRLCYVGITRAKDQLYLFRTKNRIRYGKPVPRIPSRFLAEIPEGLLLHEDGTGVVSKFGQAEHEKHEQKVKSFLDVIRAQISK